MWTPTFTLVLNRDILGSTAAMQREMDKEVYTSAGSGKIELGLVTGVNGISSLLSLGLTGSNFSKSSLVLLEHQC